MIAIAQPSRGDYGQPDMNTDNAAPVIGALIDGDLGRAIDAQPIMGPVSLLLRAPFAAVGDALGGRELEYHLGAVACLWVLALLAGVLALRTRGVSRERLTAPLVGLLLVANPVTFEALSAGHPEELLAAALATAAVLLAARDRAGLTGLALALATATKPWAALAGPVALLVLSRGHMRAILAGGLAAAVLLVPPIAANPGALDRADELVAKQTRVYATSAWWPLAEKRPVPQALDAPAAAVMPAGLSRSAGQYAILALALGLGLACLRRRPVALPDGLALLAGLMLARCVLDPVNLFYYGVPFVVALVAWEVHARRGIPLVSIAASLALWITADHPPADRDLACALYLAWSVPLAAWLASAPLRRLPAWTEPSSRLSRRRSRTATATSPAPR